MYITIITDCKDDNAKTRQTTRLSTLFSQPINFIGVDSDLEASGNLIDIIDASNSEEGIILVNVAPRHKEAKKWENGTPFGYFHYKNTLIISSIDGLTLSLVKKFNLTESINLMGIPEVLKSLLKQNIIDQNLYEHIVHTQFRSFEFVPRVAKWLSEDIKIPSTKYSLTEIKDAPNAIWWIDNFGNCKTTLTKNDIEVSEDINTKVGKLKYYSRLKLVPDDTPAIITGSSGIENNRFLEIVVQGKSAKEILSLKSGQEI